MPQELDLEGEFPTLWHLACGKMINRMSDRFWVPCSVFLLGLVLSSKLESLASLCFIMTCFYRNFFFFFFPLVTEPGSNKEENAP